MVRRYETMDSEAGDEYTRYQAHRKTAGGGVDRYQVGRPSLKNRQITRKAKFIWVYTSGEKYKYDPAIKVTFSKKCFPQLPSLLDEIQRAKQRIHRITVKYLFKWPTGEEVFDVNEIEEDVECNTYVSSDVKKLKLYDGVCFGGMKFGGGIGGSAFTEKYSRASHESQGTTRSDKQSPTVRRSNGSMIGGPKGSVYNITIISNTNRNSKQSLFIDPKSNLPFEDILKNVQEMIDMDFPPCKALYTEKKPHKKVDSISSLNRVLPRYGDTFWACGTEGEPIEMTNGSSRDTSPQRNGHNQRQKNAGKQNGKDERMQRQTNGHARQSDIYEDSYGREFQRHHDQHDEDVEQDEADREPSPPQSKRRGQADQSTRRDYRQDVNNQRRDEEEETPRRRDNRQATNNPRHNEEDESPRRDKRQATNNQRHDEDEYTPRRENRQATNNQRRDVEEEAYSRDNRRGSEQPTKQTPKRQQTPPRKRDDKGDTQRGQTNDDEKDDDDKSRSISPTDEETKEKKEAMERVDSDLDRKIQY